MSRYLHLLRDVLLAEHYLENELRIAHLLAAATAGAPVDGQRLADPARYMSKAFTDRERRAETGDLPGSSESAISHLALADTGRVRLDHLEACVVAIASEEIPGDLVDCGSDRPGTAIYLSGLREEHALSGREVWVSGLFQGSDSLTAEGTISPPADLNATRRAFARFDLLDGVRFLQGPASETLPGAPVSQAALLRVDGHDAAEVEAALGTLYDKVSDGGFIVIDDYGHPDCQRAVDAFRAGRGLTEPLERIDASAAVWRKSGSAAAPEPTPPAQPEPAPAKDLSVIVVAYDMQREAARTLHSLSRAYQRGLEGVDYEVIVVENGSPPDRRLGEDFVRSFGSEFTYIDLGEDAHPSPAGAVNAGIVASSGAAIAIMIDGAHVLTPGVLRNGLLALSTYEPAVAAVKQWYVGPGQQPVALAGGYSQELEDRLFEHVEWPLDGYRLFEIGHFIGERDWFDGDWESNCIFVPRTLIEQAGGMDESFSTPGGAFVNLEFYERMMGSPGVNLVTILGEGSFHQVHGGTTTNVVDFEERGKKIRAYGDDYEEIRGMRFMIPEPPTYLIGALPPAARRTRRRPMSAEAFRFAALPEDQRPSRPSPVPGELRTEFTEAFWRSEAWREASWLGERTHRPPTDLFAYAELCYRVRPDWIIETRTGSGGRALFLATVCDLVGTGQVLSVDEHPLEGRPEHGRLTYFQGDPGSETTGQAVRDAVGPEPNAMVILGAAGRPQLLAAFDQLSPLVPIGSYVIVEDTHFEGNPVWSAFGPGPNAALDRIKATGEFMPDPEPERYAVTFNPGGFLRRVSGPAS